jgi:MFS family permease
MDTLTGNSLFPGVAYYITMWYCRHEAQFRQALFFSAASVAGAFSGLLAYGIAHMDGVGGLAGWRWIFILEGILTVIVAILAYFILFDFPETATFLTEEERAFVVYRLKYQGSANESEVKVAQDDTFQWKYVKAAFLDWQIWTNIWVYWGKFWQCLLLDCTDGGRYRCASLRHLSLPSDDHQRAWIHFVYSPAPYSPDLRDSFGSRGDGSILQ